uniref:C-type lectin domain-containing protein n=1 Tax=Monopterus albus TaxID=43700 RepID=A0A3Q3IRR9_MONAL
MGRHVFKSEGFSDVFLTYILFLSPTELRCSGPDWYEFGGFCYKPSEPATWDAAQKACVEQNGNLASIDMSYDQAFVAGVVLQGKADAWIGLRRKVLSGVMQNGWAWTDRFALGFLNWAPETCVEMYSDGRWNDNNCLQKRGFACRHPECKDSDCFLSTRWNREQLLSSNF